jgi:enoyl-CoA hydratase
MTYASLIVEVIDHTCLIRLNRPEAMNALNAALMRELSGAMTAADTDDAIRCIVLTGSERAFAAGADIKEMADKSYADVVTQDLFGPEVHAINAVRKPVIAAVAGYCLGGGCELAMMVDFIIAADTAKFGQPEVNLGIVAGMGGTQRLARIVGKAKAMDMNLTGRFMDAAEAERAGLVSRIVAADALIPEALAIAAKIGEKSMITLRAIKECINRAQESTLREGLLFERRMFHALFATEDQKEGMNAFLAKRQPKFRDK